MPSLDIRYPVRRARVGVGFLQGALLLLILIHRLIGQQHHIIEPELLRAIAALKSDAQMPCGDEKTNKMSHTDHNESVCHLYSRRYSQGQGCPRPYSGASHAFCCAPFG